MASVLFSSAPITFPAVTFTRSPAEMIADSALHDIEVDAAQAVVVFRRIEEANELQANANHAERERSF